MTAKVFTVENRKGGVGKTTTAVTLGVGLARRLYHNGGGNVLIIDMDPQGDAARGLGLDPNGRCISNILRGDGSVDNLRENVISANRSKVGGPKRPNLFVLPASDELSEAKKEILGDIAMKSYMAAVAGKPGHHDIKTILDEKFGLAKRAFKYIIIDCPPTLDMLQQAIHQFADAAIVPVKVDYHGTSATGRHTNNILEDQAQGIDIKIKAIVPTFVHPRHNLTKAMLAELRQVYGKHLVATPIPNTVRVAEAPAKDLTILEYEPDSPAADAYMELVNMIYEEA